MPSAQLDPLSTWPKAKEPAAAVKRNQRRRCDMNADESDEIACLLLELMSAGGARPWCSLTNDLLSAKFPTERISPLTRCQGDTAAYDIFTPLTTITFQQQDPASFDSTTSNRSCWQNCDPASLRRRWDTNLSTPVRCETTPIQTCLSLSVCPSSSSCSSCTAGAMSCVLRNSPTAMLRKRSLQATSGLWLPVDNERPHKVQRSHRPPHMLSYREVAPTAPLPTQWLKNQAPMQLQAQTSMDYLVPLPPSPDAQKLRMPHCPVPCAPPMLSLLRTPGSTVQDLLQSSFKSLGFLEASTLQLALHCFARLCQSPLLTLAQPSVMVQYGVVVVWMAAKLEEGRSGLAGGKKVADFIGATAQQVSAMEIEILQCLDWSPYRGFVCHDILFFL